MPPYRQRSGGSPRARCGSLCAGRGPPAVLSGRRFGSVGCGARRLRGPQRLRALPSPPRHFKWGRGCGAARDGGNEGFRRLRAAGERHPSWVSRAHPSLPLRRIYHFIDSLRQKPIWLLPLYLRSVHFQIFQVSCHHGGHLCALGLRGRVNALTAYAVEQPPAGEKLRASAAPSQFRPFST